MVTYFEKQSDSQIHSFYQSFRIYCQVFRDENQRRHDVALKEFVASDSPPRKVDSAIYTPKSPGLLVKTADFNLISSHQIDLLGVVHYSFVHKTLRTRVYENTEDR